MRTYVRKRGIAILPKEAEKGNEGAFIYLKKVEIEGNTGRRHWTSLHHGGQVFLKEKRFISKLTERDWGLEIKRVPPKKILLLAQREAAQERVVFYCFQSRKR